MLARRPAAAALAVLALTFTATLVLWPWSDESVGDLGVRASYARLLLDGALPYRDFPFEYPPLAAPAIALPGIAGAGDEAYRLGIAAVTFILTAAVLGLAGALARRTGGSRGAAMLAVAAAPLLLGAVARLHFDPLAVALTLGALVALLDRRPALGLALVGLGAATKGFPIVVAPVALAWLWSGGDRRGAIRGGGALAATLVVLGSVWLAPSPQGALDSLTYQLDRPVQIESSPASVLFAVGAMGGDDPSVVESHRSAGLLHPLDGRVGLAFSVGLLAAVGALSWGAAVAARRASARAPARSPGDPGRIPPANAGAADPRPARALVLGALAAVVAFAAFGRVLSPQYLVWVVPLAALAVAWRMRALAALGAAACALTFAEFPARYLDLVDGEPLAVAITSARNAALAAAVGLAGALLWRGARAPAPSLTAAAGAPARSIAPVRPARPR